MDATWIWWIENFILRRLYNYNNIGIDAFLDLLTVPCKNKPNVIFVETKVVVVVVRAAATVAVAVAVAAASVVVVVAAILTHVLHCLTSYSPVVTIYATRCYITNCPFATVFLTISFDSHNKQQQFPKQH